MNARVAVGTAQFLDRVYNDRHQHFVRKSDPIAQTLYVTMNLPEYSPLIPARLRCIPEKGQPK